jgi:hypothetical protein
MEVLWFFLSRKNFFLKKEAKTSDRFPVAAPEP